MEAVFIKTEHLQELAKFYQEAFDLETPSPGDEGQLGFQIGEVYLAIEKVSENAAPSNSVTLWFRVADVSVTYERLLRLGARIKSAPEKMGRETIAVVLDPDGNEIGIISR